VPDGHYFPSADISGLNRAFYFDITSYLPGDILVKVDRATMANGLESRMPFLDEDFLEFALSLPVNLKVNNTQTKIILRQAMWQYWPSQLINRKKEGFNVPVNIWLKTPEMQALARRIFSKKSPLRQLLPGLRATDSSLCRYRTWILITLGVWLRYHGISVSQ
jgi:asparagine synthase (glutamine-hydrolysing)